MIWILAFLLFVLVIWALAIIMGLVWWTSKQDKGRRIQKIKGCVKHHWEKATVDNLSLSRLIIVLAVTEAMVVSRSNTANI